MVGDRRGPVGRHHHGVVVDARHEVLAERRQAVGGRRFGEGNGSPGAPSASRSTPRRVSRPVANPRTTPLRIPTVAHRPSRAAQHAAVCTLGEENGSLGDPTAHARAADDGARVPVRPRHRALVRRAA
ncbi:hypothetical protein GCM10010972_15620 [Cellulomonas carbonis]|nr:hypothetical protein GCM10010972_15620 [Cellulomonas carbonis]